MGQLEVSIDSLQTRSTTVLYMYYLKWSLCLINLRYSELGPIKNGLLILMEKPLGQLFLLFFCFYFKGAQENLQQVYPE